MNRIIFALLLTVLAFLFCNAAMLPAAAQTVHALLIIMDEDDKIGPSCAVDRHYIENLLLRDVEYICKVETKTLLSSNGTATPGQVARWLDSVNPASDDVVFIYYSGHGGMGDWANQRTYLATLKGRLWRDDLVEWIDTKTGGARLKMLITDCCSSTNEPPPKSQQIEKAAVTADMQMFKNLFLEHHGVLHITGATEGEFSFGRNPEYLERPWTFLEGGYGGAFTRGIIHALESRPDLNEDGFVSWEEVFFKTRENTMASFKRSTFSDKTRRKMERLGITNQTPKAYSSFPVNSKRYPYSVSGGPPGMVLIPAGEFQMGSNNGFDHEKPVHTVYLDAFYMDVHEVTVGQYKTFLRATGHRELPDEVFEYSPTDSHPVVGVSWRDAMAYATWAGKRLPTEAEWEKAARGGRVGQTYPWGNAIDASKANFDEVGNMRVVSYAPNGYGLYDMAGNVREWCLDAYERDFYARSPRRNPLAGEMTLRQVSVNYKNVNVKTSRVLRGGSCFDSAQLLRVACRFGGSPAGTYVDTGFRCARAVTP